jgi:hypothetical protein
LQFWRFNILIAIVVFFMRVLSRVFVLPRQELESDTYHGARFLFPYYCRKSSPFYNVRNLMDEAVSFF